MTHAPAGPEGIRPGRVSHAPARCYITAMPYKVAALYRFVPLPDFRLVREPLRRLCEGLGLKGTLLLAQEGLNGTVAGTAGAIDSFVAELRTGSLFGGRLDGL